VRVVEDEVLEVLVVAHNPMLALCRVGVQTPVHAANLGPTQVAGGPAVGGAHSCYAGGEVPAGRNEGRRLQGCRTTGRSRICSTLHETKARATFVRS